MPTVCIEQVFVWNNNTVIVDEVLSHRLGLVPLNVDPVLMTMRGPSILTSSPPESHFLFTGPNDPPTDQNTIVFHVDITCQRNPNAPKGSTDPHELFINSEFLSSHLKWAPAGEQEEVFTGKPPAPTNLNIVLAKLRPGQQVNMELHAVKGVGKDHAKFSPVGTFFFTSRSFFDAQVRFLYSDSLIPLLTTNQNHKTYPAQLGREIPKVLFTGCDQHRSSDEGGERG